MNYQDILKLDAHALKQKIEELSKELSLLNLKKSIASGSVKDVSIFRKTRTLIAQHKSALAQHQ